MMTEVACPSREELQSFVGCTLSEEDLGRISDHLDSCASCEDVVAGFESQKRVPFSDPANTPTFVYQSEPEYQNLVKKAEMTRIQDVSFAATAARVPELPDYRIVRLIDRGGMGSVFEAIQIDTDRRVAVKVLNEGTDRSKQALQLFLREADVLSRLKHASIVQFEEVGKSGETVYIAMEYVETLEIRKLLQSRPTDKRIRAACGLICQILSALEMAHSQGMVHRDIKPGNILVTKIDGKLLAKLSDFGLAKSFETAGYSGITSEGEARGTLGYMAPEQFVDSRSVKPIADLYSVGVTLFYYLTGRLPFETIRNPADAARVLRKPPLPLEHIMPEAPQELSEILAQAMSYAPDERIPSARAFRESLMRFVRRPSR
ncbi:MAG: serine/threonine protein kinase [Planctomycetaceae bacterium]|nr:serine/threonine protein kinase [Planctomycetaceae bacterium]